MLTADGLNFLRKQTLFGLLPDHAVAPESWGISSQLAFQKGMNAVSLNGATCWFYFVLHIYNLHYYMSHVVTRTFDSTLTCKTHRSVVAQSCTASRSSFTWGWTDGPKHEGVGKTLTFHHVQGVTQIWLMNIANCIHVRGVSEKT